MKKIVLAGLLGGIVLYVWSFLAWFVLPIHATTMRGVSNEDALRAMLRDNMTQKGVYAIPYVGPGSDKAAMDAFQQKVREGPNGMIVYDPNGTDPMMLAQMVIGFFIDVLSAALAAWFLSRSTAAAGGYFARVVYCGMLGVFVSIFSHLVMWNWMGFPADLVRDLIVDSITSWILAGIAIAAIIKAPRLQTPAVAEA